MTTSTALRTGLIVLAVVAGLAAGYYGLQIAMGESAAAQEGGESGSASTSVTVTSPETRELIEQYDTVGTLLARREIEVTPASEGRVTDMRLTSGTTVSEGDLLFALEDAAERATLAQAEATLSQAESAYRRREELSGENVASQAELESARATFREAEAEVALARNALDDRHVRAPFTGRVGLVDLDRGELVTPDTVVTTLQDVSRMRVDFEVPGRYYTRLATGQSVRLSGDSIGEETFTGEVTAVAPQLSETTRSVPVRATVANPDRALAGGMFVSVTLIFDRYEAPTIPDDAVISEGETTYVFTVTDGSASRREIELGNRTDGAVEVVSGLPDDVRVVTSGYAELEDGAPVEVVERDGSNAGAQG